MTAYGAVFARGGSKGVPGKNLRHVGGASLLAHAIASGQQAQLVDRLIVSTDAETIAAEARSLGAEVPFLRPAELSHDQSPEWEAWQHLARHLISDGASDSDLLISLPTTSPLRVPDDIDNAVRTFLAGEFDLVLAISPATRNPWFNMVKRRESGRIELAISDEISSASRRQDAPELFDVTTVVYVTTLKFVINASRIFEGAIGSITVPNERAIDIDTELDVEIADYLIRKRLGLAHG